MARLWLLAAALLFSTGGAAIKGNSLTAWQVASYRSLVAALVLSLIFPETRRNWTRRHLVAGLAYAGTLIAFVGATKLTTAANATFLQATAPGYLAILGPLLLKERLRKSDLWLLLAVGTGMSLFFLASDPASATAPDPATGNLLGMLSGVCWAFTVTGLRWLHEGGLKMVVVGSWLTFLLALPASLPIPVFTASDTVAVLYLGVIQVALAYYCLTKGIRSVPAFEAATLMLIEPAMNPVWTWMAMGERPGALSIAGGTLILTATLLNTWLRSRSESQN